MTTGHPFAGAVPLGTVRPMQTASIRAGVTMGWLKSMLPPLPAPRYGAAPCWKIGICTSAAYSSNRGSGVPQLRSASCCGQGEVAPALHSVQLVTAGAVVRARTDGRIWAAAAPGAPTVKIVAETTCDGAMAVGMALPR